MTTEKDCVKLGDESVAVVESARQISGIKQFVERIVALTREGQRS